MCQYTYFFNLRSYVMQINEYGFTVIDVYFIWNTIL